MLFTGTGTQFLEKLSQKEIESLSCLNDSDTLKYFDFGDLYSSQYYWWIIYENYTIKGMVKTQVSSLATKALPFHAINYITINQNYQGQGLARMLLSLVFSHFKNQYLLGTRYSTEGRNLKLLAQKLAKENNVYFVDKDLLNELSELDSFPPDTASLYKYY